MVAITVILFSSFTILVPLIARWKIEKWMKENGEDRVRIERVAFNPFILRLRVYSLFAEGFQKGKIGWKRMAFEIDVWPLHQKRLVINDFVLHDALLTVQQTKNRNWVVGGIPLIIGRSRSNGGKEKRGWEFGLAQIRLSNVQIQYRNPDFNQKLLIREAVVDTFRSWEVEKKSSFSIQALISGGVVDISGKIDPQGGDRSIVSSIHILSLPLQWFSPAVQNSGLPGINGLVTADFKVTGHMSKKQYTYDASGWGEITSISTGINGAPYAVDVSRIFYNGSFKTADSAVVRINDECIITNATVRDTLRKIIVMKLDTGKIGEIIVGKETVGAGIARLKGIYTFADTSSSEQRDSEPFAIRAGSIEINKFFMNGRRSKIAAGSVVLQALKATLIRDQDGIFRITKQFPSERKVGKMQQTKRSESGTPQVSIKRFSIGGGSQIEIRDLTVDPQVIIQTTDLLFTLNDMAASNAKAPGKYLLTATIQPQTTLKAEGTIGPIFPVPDVTIKSQIKHFNAQKLSSYMLNLFGYEIDSGRLDGVIEGKVVNKQLDMVSLITVNNLEITPVPSQSIYDKYKDAFMGMSLESALSIITDKNGDVRLTIPVNGNLSNPEFNFSDILRAAIVNSISGGLNSVLIIPGHKQ